MADQYLTTIVDYLLILLFHFYIDIFGLSTTSRRTVSQPFMFQTGDMIDWNCNYIIIGAMNHKKYEPYGQIHCERGPAALEITSPKRHGK